MIRLSYNDNGKWHNEDWAYWDEVNSIVSETTYDSITLFQRDANDNGFTLYLEVKEFMQDHGWTGPVWVIEDADSREPMGICGYRVKK